MRQYSRMHMAAAAVALVGLGGVGLTIAPPPARIEVARPAAKGGKKKPRAKFSFGSGTPSAVQTAIMERAAAKRRRRGQHLARIVAAGGAIALAH